jgi:hypothetical protein
MVGRAPRAAGERRLFYLANRSHPLWAIIEVPLADDEARQGFLAFAELEVWFDPATPHRMRGIEHAADVISWGVDDQQFERCQVRSFPDLVAGYEILTGALPPRAVVSANSPSARDTLPNQRAT